MRISYQGGADQVEADLADGRTLIAARGEWVTVPDEEGRRLVDEGGGVWVLESHYGAEFEPPPLAAARVSEVARQAIHDLRRQHGWTQAQLVKQLERIGYPLSQAQLSKLESGQRRLSLDDLLALAAALDSSPFHLLTGLPSHRTGPVAITERLGVTLRRFRQWLRHQQPPPAPRPRDGTADPGGYTWSQAFYRQASDEQWLAQQRDTLERTLPHLHQIANIALPLADGLSAKRRQQLEHALDQLSTLIDQLEQTQADRPSERPRRQEHRGRPRTAARYRHD